MYLVHMKENLWPIINFENTKLLSLVPHHPASHSILRVEHLILHGIEGSALSRLPPCVWLKSLLHD